MFTCCRLGLSIGLLPRDCFVETVTEILSSPILITCPTLSNPKQGFELCQLCGTSDLLRHYAFSSISHNPHRVRHHKSSFARHPKKTLNFATYLVLFLLLILKISKKKDKK